MRTLDPKWGRQCARAARLTAAPRQCFCRAQAPLNTRMHVVLALTAASLPGEWECEGTLDEGDTQGYPPLGSPPITPGGLHLPKWGFVWSGTNREYVVLLRGDPYPYAIP